MCPRPPGRGHIPATGARFGHGDLPGSLRMFPAWPGYVALRRSQNRFRGWPDRVNNPVWPDHAPVSRLRATSWVVRHTAVGGGPTAAAR